MKRFLAGFLCLLLLCAWGCSAKPQTPEFVAPTPAAEAPEATPVPEPAPTQKPYSEYNEMLEKLRYGSTESSGMRVRPYYTTLRGVEGGSELIVLATVLEKEHIEYQTDYGTWEGHQEGTALIHKVYKGSDVKEGYTIRLREYINIPTYADGSRALISHGRYFFPTKEYGTYLLFLEKGDGEYYLPTDDYCGKYPVNPAIAEAYEADALTYDLMEILQKDRVMGGVDRNVPPQDFVNIHKEVYAKYYKDEAIIASLEEQRKYEEHYGRPEPAPTFEPVPAEEDVFWLYSGNQVIYVPAQTVPDAASLKEAHGKMNEKGYNAEELPKLTADRSGVEIYLKAVSDYDGLGFNVDEKMQYGHVSMTTVYDMNGEKVETMKDHPGLGLNHARRAELGMAVISVTAAQEDHAGPYYHGFFLVEFPTKVD